MLQCIWIAVVIYGDVHYFAYCSNMLCKNKYFPLSCSLFFSPVTVYFQISQASKCQSKQLWWKKSSFYLTELNFSKTSIFFSHPWHTSWKRSLIIADIHIFIAGQERTKWCEKLERGTRELSCRYDFGKGSMLKGSDFWRDHELCLQYFYLCCDQLWMSLSGYFNIFHVTQIYWTKTNLAMLKQKYVSPWLDIG